MKAHNAKRLDIDLGSYAKRSALETDYTTFITEDTIVCLDGEPVILYQKLDWDLEPLRAVVRGIEYQTTTRSGGLKTTSRVFGYQPRIALRRDFCAATTLQQREARKAAVIQTFGTNIANIYQKHFPTVYEKHSKWTEGNVREEWKIKSTPFTSGIINKNNPLKYHFDAGNIKDVCSCMIGLKRSVGGGVPFSTRAWNRFRDSRPKLTHLRRSKAPARSHTNQKTFRRRVPIHHRVLRTSTDVEMRTNDEGIGSDSEPENSKRAKACWPHRRGRIACDSTRNRRRKSR